MSIYFQVPSSTGASLEDGYEGCFSGVAEFIQETCSAYAQEYEGFIIDLKGAYREAETSMTNDTNRCVARCQMWEELILPFMKPEWWSVREDGNFFLSKDVPYWLIVPATWMMLLDTQITNASLKYVWYRAQGLSPIMAYYGTIHAYFSHGSTRELCGDALFSWANTEEFEEFVNECNCSFMQSCEQIPWGTVISNKEAIKAIFSKTPEDIERLAKCDIGDSETMEYYGRDDWWSGYNTTLMRDFNLPPAMFHSFGVFEEEHFIKSGQYRPSYVSFKVFFRWLKECDQVLKEEVK